MDYATTSTATAAQHDGEDQYETFLSRVGARFAATGTAPLFTTDAEGLYQAFIDALPVGRRQHYTCHNCRHFVERFGALVTIGKDGATTSAIWHLDDAPAFFHPSIDAMLRLVRRAKVTGVFLSSDRTWGQHETPGKGCAWHHFAVTPPASRVYRATVLTAGQAMAEKREDRNNVARALGEYTKPVVDEALRVLRSDTLYRAEKVIGPAEWLAKLHDARDGLRGPAKENALWLAIATAPAGFCHPRSSMVGTLLDDIAAGMLFDEVARRFKDKMHPLQYQRPQAAPTAGAIAVAEKLVEKMGITPSLARRYARLDEIETIWTPKPPKDATPGGGVFAHLKPKGAPAALSPLVICATPITWEKFARTVLPTADAIDFFTRNQNDAYAALVTAVNADAPPILQWDREDRRNPVSWYLWNGGSQPRQWSLPSAAFVRVTAVSLKPSMWGDKPLSHQGEGVLLVLDGAHDSRNAGAALFPEILRAELHGVRSVIEAYSRSATIADMDTASACGIMLHKGAPWNHLVRVASGGAIQEYTLDRWD